MPTPIHTTRSTLVGELIQGFDQTRDAVHLHSGSVRRCFIQPKSNIPLDTAHMDGVQIIDQQDISPYALPYLDYFQVTQSVVDGETTPIQCCFASDGIFGYADITDNTFRTSGQHFITINGLLSGRITGNEFSEGAVNPIKLYPARPGGSPDGDFNIWILHFKGDQFSYQPIECDTPELVQDFRQTVFNKSDKFLIQFDYDKFEALAAQVPAGGGRVMGRAFQQIALQCGELVAEFTKPVGVNMYELSDKGRDLLVASEGAESEVYTDINGYETIGIGHKITGDERASGTIFIGTAAVPFYQRPLTNAEVYQLFAQDVKSRITTLNKALADAKVTLTQNQFDALFSFYYNVGHGTLIGNATRKPSTVWTRLVAGDLAGVPEAISWYNKYKGGVSRGLTLRRERTIALWEGLPMLSKEADNTEKVAADAPLPPVANTPAVTSGDWEEAALREVAQDTAWVGRPDIPAYLINHDVPLDDRLEWVMQYAPEQWLTATMIEEVSAPAPPAPAVNTPAAPVVAVHEKKLSSTTLQGIVGMGVSAAATYAVSKWGLPESVTTLVQPVIVESLLGLIAGLFGARAWTGRLNAVKGFKA